MNIVSQISTTLAGSNTVKTWQFLSITNAAYVVDIDLNDNGLYTGL